MPLYLDLHKLSGETPEDVALAHLQDIETQWKHGVRYLRYWFNEERDRLFCLTEAPSKEAANTVHREGHGLVADEIIQVEGGLIEALLGSTDEVPAWTRESASSPPAESAFRTIMFTDMEGSTETTQRIGDAAAMDLLRTHNAIIRDALESASGSEVKHTGDGIMASFTSVARGVECAVAIQRALASSDEDTIPVRIGLSAGEPVAEPGPDGRNDLFGAAVQLAARVCAHADAGQILVPNVVRELCIGKGYSFADRGEAALKGFAEPVRVYEVGWKDGP